VGGPTVWLARRLAGPLALRPRSGLHRTSTQTANRDGRRRRGPDEGTDATRGTRPKLSGEAGLLGGFCQNPFSRPRVLASSAAYAKVLVLRGQGTHRGTSTSMRALEEQGNTVRGWHDGMEASAQ